MVKIFSMDSRIQSVKLNLGIIGNSPRLNNAVEIALQIAPTNLSVLIFGESGVGKEAFSQIIHKNSLRKDKPYIAINCGAIPEGTIDSELFGQFFLMKLANCRNQHSRAFFVSWNRANLSLLERRKFKKPM